MIHIEHYHYGMRAMHFLEDNMVEFEVNVNETKDEVYICLELPNDEVRRITDALKGAGYRAEEYPIFTHIYLRDNIVLCLMVK